MNDSFGDRMKLYEDKFRYKLTRRTYTVMRLDGKAFHSYTKKCQCLQPFDAPLVDAMNRTALALCSQIMGAELAYVQSDEITILLTDFAGLQTQAWFDGNLQKITSVSASIATSEFNKIRLEQFHEGLWRGKNHKFVWGNFDSRVWTLSDPYEVENAFLWRQQDAERNSLQMLARSLYSHKELNGKNAAKMHDMIHAKGLNWNDLPSGQKRGRTVVKNADGKLVIDVDPACFSKDRSYLRNKIPLLPTWKDAPPLRGVSKEGATLDDSWAVQE